MAFTAVMSIIFYILLLPVVAISPQQIHNACFLIQLFVLTILVPLVLRTLGRRHSLSSLPYFILYSSPALLLSSHTALNWWAVVSAEIALLSTATAIWTVSNHLNTEHSECFWSVLFSLLLLPLLFGEIESAFNRDGHLKFFSPVAYILAPFNGRTVVSFYGTLFIWGLPAITAVLVRHLKGERASYETPS